MPVAHLRSKVAVEESVDALARRRVGAIFDRFDHIVVSFSGGKDSTICLNLALEEARRRGQLPLHVIHFDEEAIPYQTEEYVRRVAQLPDVRLDWYCLPVKHRNACSRAHPWWSPWDPAEEELWVRPMPPEGIHRIPAYDFPPMKKRLLIPDLIGRILPPSEYGTVGMLMGIRAQESLTRTRAVLFRTAEQDNYIHQDVGKSAQGNVWKCYPIYDWLTEDVWTAPNLYGWDYNAAYDVMEMAGIPAGQQRCSPAYGEEPLQKFWTYRVCFPEIWDRMSTRVPGANTAMRYATTDLYGFGGQPDKRDDMTYEQAIVHFLEKFNPEERLKIAARIREELHRHWRKTGEPIVPETPHPVTGLNWKFLLTIAARGDLKERRFAEAQLDRFKDPAALRAQYEAERERFYGPAAGPAAGSAAGQPQEAETAIGPGTESVSR